MLLFNQFLICSTFLNSLIPRIKTKPSLIHPFVPSSTTDYASPKSLLHLLHRHFRPRNKHSQNPHWIVRIRTLFALLWLLRVADLLSTRLLLFNTSIYSIIINCTSHTHTSTPTHSGPVTQTLRIPDPVPPPEILVPFDSRLATKVPHLFPSIRRILLIHICSGAVDAMLCSALVDGGYLPITITHQLIRIRTDVSRCYSFILLLVTISG